MKSRYLFIRRLQRNLQFQWKVLYSVFDWTVLLYIVLPAFIIFSFIYRSWWMEIPTWMDGIPFEWIFFLLYGLAWNGQYRSFIEEGDEIFLIKEKDLFLKVKVWGFVYSLIYESGKYFLIFLLILPFFINYYFFTLLDLALLYFFLLSCKFFFMMMKVQMRKLERRVVKYSVLFLLFFLFAYFSQFVYKTVHSEPIFFMISGCIGVAGVRGYVSTLKKLSSFPVLLEIETEQRLKFVQMIFSMSNEIQKPYVISRQKPLLFRNSNRIFSKRTAKNGFTELFLKVFIRNQMYVSTYFQMISITTAALVIVPPIWMKVILFFLFLVIIRSWIDQLWNQMILTHPFMKKYVDTDHYFMAKRQSITLLHIVSVLFVLIMASGGFVIYQFFMAM